MNYARFAEWLQLKVQELVDFGVPREEAEHICHYVEVASISAAAEARVENQFLLDFQRIGSTAMAQRHNCSPQNIRKQRTKNLKKRNRLLRLQLR